MSPPTSSQILPIILHYSAMLEHTYYSQNYASIIGQGLSGIEETFWGEDQGSISNARSDHTFKEVNRPNEEGTHTLPGQEDLLIFYNCLEIWRYYVMNSRTK